MSIWQFITDSAYPQRSGERYRTICRLIILFHLPDTGLGSPKTLTLAVTLAHRTKNYIRSLIKTRIPRNEPRHDKTNKMSVRPAKIQISLGISPVWTESSLCAQWIAKDPSLLHANSEESDQIGPMPQTGRMPRLIWVFAERTTTLLVLSCRGSNPLIV